MACAQGRIYDRHAASRTPSWSWRATPLRLHGQSAMTPGAALTPLARALVATLVFVCAWLLSAALATLHAPRWTMFTDGAVIVTSIVGIYVCLHFWTQEDEGGESDDGQGGDHRGGGPRRPRPDAPPRGRGGDLSWWGEFERQLAVYVAQHEPGTGQGGGLAVRAAATSRRTSLHALPPGTLSETAASLSFECTE